MKILIKFCFLFLTCFSLFAQVTPYSAIKNTAADVASTPIPGAVPITTLTVSMLGYNFVNDGLGGVFYWSYTNGDPASADVILSTNPTYAVNGRWLRLTTTVTGDFILSNSGMGTNTSFFGTTLLNYATIVDGLISGGLTVGYDTSITATPSNQVSDIALPESLAVDYFSSIDDMINDGTKRAGKLYFITSGDSSGLYALCINDTTATNTVTIFQPFNVPTAADPGRDVQIISQSNTKMATNLAQLLALNPLQISSSFGNGVMTNTTVRVQGYRSPGDLGGGDYFFTTDQSNTNSTGVKLAVTGGSWQLVEGTRVRPQHFGAYGDGVHDDTVAVQQAIDWVATNKLRDITSGSTFFTNSVVSHYTNTVGGSIFLPDRSTYLLATTYNDIVTNRYCLDMRLGVTIQAENQNPPYQGFPGNPSSPRFLRGTNVYGALFRFGGYVLNGETNSVRFAGLRNLILDGNYDNQANTPYVNNAILLTGDKFYGSGQNKNLVFEGISSYNNWGYDVFGVPFATGANTFNRFYGSLFYGSSDSVFFECEFNGRTKGADSANVGSPFPVLWFGRGSQKNNVSSAFFYSGPDPTNGSPNSVPTYEISSVDTVLDTITLSNTNGIYNGMPVMWNTGGTFPSAVSGTDTLMILYSGSFTIQVCSSSSWVTSRTPLSMSGAVPSGDTLTMGTPYGPLMLVSGTAQSGWSKFSHLRLEDNDGDLLEIRGSRNLSFTDCNFDFSYKTNSRYIRFTYAASGNQFGDSTVVYDSNGAGVAPEYLIEFSDDCFGNSFRNVHLSGFTGSTDPNSYNGVIDPSTTLPANSFDFEVGTEVEDHRGNDYTIRHTDLDQSITNSITFAAGSMLMQTNVGNNKVTSSTYGQKIDPSLARFTTRGATGKAPGFFAEGYTVTPRVTFQFGNGSIASPTYPVNGNTIGALFGLGYSSFDSTFTTQAAIQVEANGNWSSTNRGTKLNFLLTPTFSTNRISLFDLDPDSTTTGDTVSHLAFYDGSSWDVSNRIVKQSSGFLTLGSVGNIDPTQLGSDWATNKYLRGTGWDDIKPGQSDFAKISQESGGNIVAWSCCGGGPNQNTAGVTLADGTTLVCMIWVPETASYTGFTVINNTVGSFTGDATNSIAIASVSSGTKTIVAETANDANIWKGTANKMAQWPFAGGATVLTRGRYAIQCLYNSSAEVTAPVIRGYTALTSTQYATNGLLNSEKWAGSLAAQTTQQSPQAFSAFSTGTSVPMIGLYK